MWIVVIRDQLVKFFPISGVGPNQVITDYSVRMRYLVGIIDAATSALRKSMRPVAFVRLARASHSRQSRI